jgi:hypothetical protein
MMHAEYSRNFPKQHPPGTDDIPPVEGVPPDPAGLPHSIHVPDEITYSSCCTIDAPIVGPGAGPHAARATCAGCGKFVTWLSRYSPEEKHQRRRLRTLGYRGSVPEDREVASKLIDVLIAGEVQP